MLYTRELITLVHACKSFGGTGAVLGYTETLSNERFAANTQSISTSSEVGFSSALQVTFYFGLYQNNDVGREFEHETSQSKETTTSDTNAISFELGDPDNGDYFDVQVCFGVSV